jgi:hypothetical protein
MKRLSILFILLLCGFAQAADNIQLARMNPYVAGSVVAAGGGSCTTSNDSEIVSYKETTGSSIGFGGTAWKSQKFTLSATTTITSITLKLGDTVTYDAATVTISIYTDSSGLPSSEVSGTTVAISETAITDGAGGDAVFDLATPKELSAGTYHIVVRSSAESTEIFYKDAVSGGGYSYSSNGGSSWTAYDASAYYIVYGCQ